MQFEVFVKNMYLLEEYCGCYARSGLVMFRNIQSTRNIKNKLKTQIRTPLKTDLQPH